MRGIIKLISPNQDMIGVETENGHFSILELIGGYAPEVGDIVTGELESLGGEEVLNRTQNEEWDVFIQDIYASKQSAWALISKH